MPERPTPYTQHVKVNVANQTEPVEVLVTGQPVAISVEQPVSVEVGQPVAVTITEPLSITESAPVLSDINFDAFGRLRVSNPTSLFDAQLTYNLSPLLYEAITAESGAAVAHDATNRMALMTLASAPNGGKAYMQTYEYFRYQPGKGNLCFITFNMKGGVANVQKFAGYSDGANGIEFLMNGTTPSIRILSDTGVGDVVVAQESWNLDTMDGNGPSGILLDFTKTQILALDFQALYVGRVRIGFDVSGMLYYVHEFNHANDEIAPYIQSANLPIRCGMTCTDTASTTMNFICCSVISEGGQEDNLGFLFSAEGTATAGNGADTHILSIQPKTTFNSITNRIKMVLESVDIIVTGNSPVLWKLCLGQALTSISLTDVNATYSGMQTVAGTLSSTPAIIVAQGYVGATATTKQAISKPTAVKYPITLDAAGAARDLGRITVLVQGIGGNSATRCVLNWKEIR